MILVDTGPLVALFDPRDGQHERCRAVLKKLTEPLLTTLPVLTEAFHLLPPASLGAANLRRFVAGGAVTVWHPEASDLSRALDLMKKYQDVPMDLADASLVVAAEALRTRRVFSLDRRHFAVYRLRWGNGSVAFELV